MTNGQAPMTQPCRGRLFWSLGFGRWSFARSRLRLLASLWLLVAVVGCGPAANDNAVQRVPEGAPTSISLRVTGAEGYEETLADLHGKVVLVDFWATWCAPCIEQFPHTVALARKYDEQGLAVVGVSMNVPGEEQQVREFLTSQDAHFTNLLSAYDSGVEAIEAFGLPGPVPCYRVYDRKGELRHEFVVDPRAEKQFTLEDIEAAIKERL